MFSILLNRGSSFQLIVAELVAYFVVIIFSISLHEFSHAYTACKMGDITPRAYGRLTINPFKHMKGVGMFCLLFAGFGWAEPVPINPLKFRNYKKGMVLVSLSGVFANIMVAFILSCPLYFLTGVWNVSGINLFLNFLYFIMYYGVIINLALAVFNILPIYPLDGFNFIKTFCSYENKYVNFMMKYGPIILLIVFVIPYFSIPYRHITGGILSLFFNFWGLF